MLLKIIHSSIEKLVHIQEIVHHDCRAVVVPPSFSSSSSEDESLLSSSDSSLDSVSICSQLLYRFMCFDVINDESPSDLKKYQWSGYRS